MCCLIVNGQVGWDECIGFTYEPNVKEWTLRTGESTEYGQIGVKSILLNCANEQSKFLLCSIDLHLCNELRKTQTILEI